MKSFKLAIENSHLSNCIYYSNKEFSYILHDNTDTLKKDFLYLYEDDKFKNFYCDQDKWENKFFWFIIWKGLYITGICKLFVKVLKDNNKSLQILYLDVIDNDAEAKKLICEQIIIYCKKQKILLHEKILFL